MHFLPWIEPKILHLSTNNNIEERLTYFNVIEYHVCDKYLISRVALPRIMTGPVNARTETFVLLPYNNLTFWDATTHCKTKWSVVPHCLDLSFEKVAKMFCHPLSHLRQTPKVMAQSVMITTAVVLRNSA